MTMPAQTDLLRDIAIGLEPIIKKRIADELYPRIDEILREEVSKVALRLTTLVTFEGNKIVISIEDRRKP